MQKQLYKNNIWQQLIRSSIQFPIDWSMYQKEFEIKKLQLQKLQPKQILERKNQFERKYQLQHRISKSWMENQYRLFIWFLFLYSKILFVPPELFGPIEWNVISQCFSKQPLFCQYFYYSSKKMKSSQWTKQEDNFVQSMMKTQLNKKWTQIGLQLFSFSEGKFFKKPKAIRQRWLSHLDPGIKKEDWDVQQDLVLIRNIIEHGKKWSKIARKIGNRTQHAIKNRYNQLITKYQKQNPQKLPPCSSSSLSAIDQQCILLLIKKSLDTIKEQATKSQGKIVTESSLTIEQPCLVKKEEEYCEHFSFSSMKIFTPIILSNLEKNMENNTDMDRNCQKKPIKKGGNRKQRKNGKKKQWISEDQSQ